MIGPLRRVRRPTDSFQAGPRFVAENWGFKRRELIQRVRILDLLDERHDVVVLSGFLQLRER